MASPMAISPIESSYGLPFLERLDEFKNMEKDLFSGNNYQLIIAEINISPEIPPKGSI